MQPQARIYSLKNGRTTTDPRLGRIPEHDPRSANYPIRRLLTPQAKPRSYSWPVGEDVRHQIRLDQGREGACVGYSIAHELAARPVMVQPITNNDAQALYRGAQNNDEWPGNQYSGTSVLGGMKFATALGYYLSYAWTDSADELAIVTSRKGPCVLGINWYDGMFDVDEDGYLYPVGNVAGGHAILCKGYSVSRRAFLLHNSWGDSWGMGREEVKGCAWLRHEDMQQLLDEDGEACLPLRNSYQRLVVR